MSYEEGDGRADGIGGAPVEEAHGKGSSGAAIPAASRASRQPSFAPDAFEAYRYTDLELIRLHAPRDLDAHGRSIGKAPFKGWRVDAPLDFAAASRHLAEGSNVGVRLRPVDLVLDVDPRHFVDGDDPVARLASDLSVDLSNYPTCVTGSGGWHIYMLKPADAQLVETLDQYPGVEFKTHGRQVVAAGSSHPATGAAYRWDDDALAVSIRELPSRAAPSALLALAARRASPVGADAGGGYSPEQLDEWLGALAVAEFRDHDRWLSLMMAAHHATGGDGRDEFVAWSTADPQYADDTWSVGRRWDSLSADGAGSRVTAGTLFMELKRAGRADLIPRPSAEEDFPEDLEAFSVPSAAEIEGEPVKALVSRMNETFCAVLEAGEYHIYMRDVDDLYDPPRPVLTRLGRNAFRHYHENELIALPDQRRKVSVADIWLKNPEMRKYPGICLDPSGRELGKLNLWQGWSVEPAPGDWSLMRELIEEVLCAGDRGHADYLLRWIAFMLQHPGVQPQAAVAFRGNEGTGKSTLGRALMRIAGRHGITVSSSKQLAGNFNAHLRNAVFVFADEALWPGNKESEGTLKQLVTEPVISFEPKGKDVVQGRNLVHLMMASNEEWVVPAGKDARRFAVFDVSDARRNDHVFFDRLNRQMDGGGLAAMLHDLLAIDLDGWHPARNVPQTQALAEQKVHSLDPASKFWMEVLDRGSVGNTAEADWLAGPVTLGDERRGVVEEYDAFLKRNRVFSAKATEKALTAAGQALGLRAVKVERNTKRAWVLPPLADARGTFEKRIGSSGLFG